MKSLFSFLALFLTLSLGAQTYSIKGILTDAEQNVPLPGAHIMLTDQDDGMERAQVSQDDGRFVFDNLKNGTYELKITFLGFSEISQTLEVQGFSLDLGTIKMGEDAIQLEAVQIIEQALPTMQKGDTTEINAQAFKTLPDANAEDLIAKMPTVSVQNGKVQAQGEDVKQVLVDGKPFFGNDPTAALRSLPAEVVDKIQVFDQQSDQAQFTGFQDGETTKTINIITKTNMRAGQFGRVYGGIGSESFNDPKLLYQTGGQVNIFNKDQRISFVGMSNNINQQNFASEDLLGVLGSNGQRSWGRGHGHGGEDFTVNQSGGVTQTHAIGVNYSDKWGKKVSVSGSYFFNYADNSLVQLTNRQFVNTGEFQEFYDETNRNESVNINHRLNARVEIEIDSSNSLIIRPQATLQSNDGTSILFGQNIQGLALISETNNTYDAKLQAVSANVNLLWRHKFNKDRRTFSIYLSVGYAPKRGESYLFSQNNFYDSVPASDTINQFSTLDANNWTAGANFDYTEPVGKNGMLMLSYRGNYQLDNSDRETFDFLESTQDYSSLNDQLSNIFSNDYITHRLGAGYNWRKEKWMLMARGYYQHADMANDQSYPQLVTTQRSFDNFLPMAMIRYEKSRNDNFRIFYRASTNLPSVQQLQNVLDNSNSLQLSVGNPNLVQSLQHSVFGRYSKTNTEKSTVLYVLVRGSIANNYIATSTYLAQSDNPIFQQYDVTPGAQLSIPVNLDGYYNASSMLTYGFPIKPLKLNLNLDLSGGYTRTPGLINDELNYSRNTNGAVGLTIASNISDKVDFSISSRSSYNWVNNTLRTDRNSNFLSQSAQAKFSWIIWKGITFRTDLTYQYYDGLSEGFDPNYWLWNMGIGKKIFKNQRGEINLSVFDLLQQNTSLSRTITEIYTQDVQTNVLQRFVMVNFIYNLRNFGKAPEPPKEDFHGPGHWH
ncbi:MAG: TonB-dependent receptor [Lewinellaceae bacterium]|nr:TonB-dependent receptor [Lewinellaceae bacterium]